MKSKNIAGILAVFLGFLGIHKFYLGKHWAGLGYLVLSLLGLPIFIGIISIIEGLYYFAVSEEKFSKIYQKKYDTR